jgi:type II secretory pathway component HofQ
MKSLISTTGVVFVSTLFTLSSCSTQDTVTAKPAAPATPPPAAKAEAKAAPDEKAPAKAKAEKARGDIGLLDTEKNYLILVTKEGKLVTLDFDQKTKATQITPTAGKIADIGLGSSATVTYVTDQGKNVATGVEFKPAKGGD